MELLLQKLQQEYAKTKSTRLEAELNDAKKTTGAIRKQLEALTDQPASVSTRFSVIQVYVYVLTLLLLEHTCVYLRYSC